MKTFLKQHILRLSLKHTYAQLHSYMYAGGLQPHVFDNSLRTYCVIISSNDRKCETPSLDYLEPFFVGLFEGDGSLHIGRTKNKTGAYPVFQISCFAQSDSNLHMLQLIQQAFGGSINIENSKPHKKIKWTGMSQKSKSRIFQTFEKYPLLTSRKIHQYKHAIAVDTHRCWDTHVQTRDQKYDLIQDLITAYNDSFVKPRYFNAWLSGFSEAEGSFRHQPNGRLTFYICQNNDWYILNAIKTHFNSHHKLGVNKDFRSVNIQYRVSMSGKPVIQNIINHFDTYPLLGSKACEYRLFRDRFKHTEV